MDVELHLVVTGDLGETGTKAIGFCTTTTDDDAWTSGMHVDTKTITSAFDLNTADCRVRQLRHEVIADLPILNEIVGILATIGKPTRLPVGGHAEAEPVRVDLLTHQSSFPSVLTASSVTASSVTVSSVTASATTSSSVSA